MQFTTMYRAIALLCLTYALQVQASLDNEVPKLGDKEITVIPDIGRYLVNTVKMNWTEAYSECTKNKGHLVIFDTAAEASAIRDLMISLGLQSIHAGYHDQYVEGHYQSIKGQPLNTLAYSKWSDGFPLNTPAYNCGGYRRTGLQDVICAAVDASICEITIPDDYIFLPGFGYYKEHEYLSTWPEAYAACEAEGAQLVVFRSQAEVDAIIEEYGYSSHFTGIHRMFGHDTFVTIMNEPLESTGYSQWSGDLQPDSDPEYLYGSHNIDRGYFLRKLSNQQWGLCKITNP